MIHFIQNFQSEFYEFILNIIIFYFTYLKCNLKHIKCTYKFVCHVKIILSSVYYYVHD